MRKPKRRAEVAYDPTDPHSIDDAVADEEREAQTAEEQARSDFQELMRTPAGRRFVGRLLDQTLVNQTSFTGEALSTSFNEGRRNTGLWVMAQINDHAFDEYVLLIKERDA